jgi:hypothetical protein
VVRWVGECGESCPLMSISPARGRTCGRLVPVVMAGPPPVMPGGLAGWRCGSRGAAARRSRCAPGRFVLIGLVVAQRHARGDGGGFCVVFHLDSVDCAAPRVGDLPASGTYSAGAGSPASHARVGDGAGVRSRFITGACRRLVQWLRFRRSVRSRLLNDSVCPLGHGVLGSL